MKTHQASKNKAGFTIAELMIAMLAGLTIIGLVMTSFLSISLSSTGDVAYANMHTDLRHSLDLISKDLHAAASVDACTTNSSITLTVVTATGPATVRYYMSGDKLYKTSGSIAKVIADGIASVGFTMYTSTGASTTSPSAAASVEVTLTASTTVIRYNHQDELRVRAMLRNK